MRIALELLGADEEAAHAKRLCEPIDQPDGARVLGMPTKAAQRQRQITDALSIDRHFSQAGFLRLPHWP